MGATGCACLARSDIWCDFLALTYICGLLLGSWQPVHAAHEACMLLHSQPRRGVPMANTVGVNKLSVVTRDSNGLTVAFPDVCKTPSPGGPVPISYPNIARSSDGCSPSRGVFGGVLAEGEAPRGEVVSKVMRMDLTSAVGIDTSAACSSSATAASEEGRRIPAYCWWEASGWR